jgi:hypothetical protein
VTRHLVEQLARQLGLEVTTLGARLEPRGTPAQSRGGTPPGPSPAPEALPSAPAENSPQRWSQLPSLQPASEEQLVELVKGAAKLRLPLLPIGGGSHFWCAPWPARQALPDLAVDLTALSGIVAHELGDGTLTARAGTRLHTLALAARAGGQHLTPALGSQDRRATLGGTLAAGQNGWERLRYGPARHHVLGARFLLSNGQAVQSGGRLVKNVTGYDLHRLFVGSHGTLGILLEATLRLFPRPAARALLTLDGLQAESAFQRAAELRQLNLGLEQLLIADLEPRRDRVRLVVRFAGSSAGLAADISAAKEVLPGAQFHPDPAEARHPWDLALESATDSPEPYLELSGLPSHSLSLWRRLGQLQQDLHIDSPRLCQPALMSLGLTGPLPPRASLERLESDLLALAQPFHWRCPRGSERAQPRPPAVALPLRQRIEQALDPLSLFPKGRLHPAADSRS